MSDAQYHTIDDDVRILVRLCGFSPEHARAQLTAFSHREKAGLIPATRALEVLEQTASFAEDAVVDNRRQWREILRSSQNRSDALAA